MFERYTEKARRVIFFARYEASQYGSPQIESEHLLLGLLREDRPLARLLLKSVPSIETVRSEIVSRIDVRERISTSVEMPLTHECKLILSHAAEESEKLGHRHIGTEHLLLGILREEKCLAAVLLGQYGVKVTELREKIMSAVAKGIERIDLSDQAAIGSAVDSILEAWEARDAAKLTSFFADRGQFWDVHGELWITPAQIEKGLAAHFKSAEPREDVPNIRDVKFVTSEVSVVTLIWEPKPEAKKAAATKRVGSSLRMVLVLRDVHPGRHIVSAHLAIMQVAKASRKK